MQIFHEFYEGQLKQQMLYTAKDHWRFGPYTPIFLIPRTLLLSFWCGACSISAIRESNGKSQLAKYFQNSYSFDSYGG